MYADLMWEPGASRRSPRWPLFPLGLAVLLGSGLIVTIWNRTSSGLLKGALAGLTLAVEAWLVLDLFTCLSSSLAEG